MIFGRSAKKLRLIGLRVSVWTSGVIASARAGRGAAEMLTETPRKMGVIGKTAL